MTWIVGKVQNCHHCGAVDYGHGGPITRCFICEEPYDRTLPVPEKDELAVHPVSPMPRHGKSVPPDET